MGLPPSALWDQEPRDLATLVDVIRARAEAADG
jgi:hypothetical protein